MPNVGRPPKPTAAKILSGNPGRRPLNRREPKPDPKMPRCPPFLGKVAKAKWRQLAPELSRLGLLTVVDGDALAAYCQAFAELEWATAKLEEEGRTIRLPSGYVQPHPAVAMQRSAWTAIRQFAALFGLDPSSRGRLEVEGGDDPEADPLTELLSRNAAKRHA